MKKKLLPIIVLASVLGMSTLVGCNQDSGGSKPEPTPIEPTEVKVTGVSLNKTEVSLEVGGTETLVATVAPSNATNKNVSWSSSNASVVSVADGVLTAKKAGKAEITVKTEDGNHTAKAQVTVAEPAPVEVKVTGVTLNKTEVNLFKGGSETLVATVAPENATNKAVTWKSSDKDVVTVADGVLTAVDIGTAEVTVTTVDGKKTDKATVVVTIDVKSISFSNKEEDYKDLEEGDDFTLTVSIDPVTNAQQLMDAGFLTITSSDPEVASVPAGGFKVFANKEGTATITASLFGKTAELELKVARRIPNKEKYGTEHEGNAEDPFTNEDALKVAKAMEAERFPSVKEKYAFYIKGEVESFYSSHLPGSGQTICSWYLKPNSGTEKFEAYKIEKADNSETWAADDIWVGAVVTFTATKLAVYGTQYETATGKVVKIEGTKPEPQKTIEATVAEALEVAGKLESGKSTYDKYVVEGFVTAVTTAWDPAYNNLSFSIAAEEGGEPTLGAYRCKINTTSTVQAELDAAAAKIIPGAKVKVTGVLNKNDTTLRFAQGCVVDLIAEAEVKPLESLDVVKELTVMFDDAAELVVKPVPASAKLDGIKFVSADETIATVSQSNGKYMVDGKAVGETTITVSVGDISAVVNVKVIGAIKYGTEEAPLTVEEAIETISLTGTSLTAEKLWVRGIISEHSAYSTSYKNFTEIWLQNSDGTVAKAFEIYRGGVKEGLDYNDIAPGKQITVNGYAKRYNTTYEICNKDDENPVITKIEEGPAASLSGISLDLSEKEIEVGKEFTLKVSPVPANAELGAVEWSSSAEAVASVDENGKVTAVAAGSATITAKVGDFTAECAVTVIAAQSNKDKYGTDHEGTVEDPFTNEDALKVAKAQESSKFPTNDEDFYIKGEVESFYSSHAPGLDKDICSWYLKPNSGTEKFEAYKIAKSNASKWVADDIWVGAVVTFKTNKFAAYKGQYETADGTLVKVEGEKPAEQQTIEATVAEALEEAGKLEAGKTTYDKYAVEGFITEVTTEWSTSYKNISFKLATTVDGEETILAYRCGVEGADDAAKNALGAKLLAGAKVKVTGVLEKNVYEEVTTLRFAQGCIAELLEEAPLPELTGIALNKHELTLGVAGEETLLVSPIPERAELGAVTWTSTDETVATVDENGKVTAVAAGTATIRVALTTDETKYDECAVTVSSGEVIVTYDAVLAAGTNGSAATVNDISAIKVGTAKADGNMTVTVAAGATKLTLHIASWKGTSADANVAIAIGTADAVNYVIKADNGITSNTPFTLEGNAEDFVIEIELTDITAETVITISSGTARRFVVWGATYVK